MQKSVKNFQIMCSASPTMPSFSNLTEGSQLHRHDKHHVTSVTMYMLQSLNFVFVTFSAIFI